MSKNASRYSRLQNGKVVDAGLIADRGTNKVRGRIRHRDSDAGNDRATRIVNHAADAGLRLRQNRQNTEDDNE